MPEQNKELTLCSLVFLSIALILFISSASKRTWVALKLSAILFGFTDLGMTTTSWWSWKDKHTCVWVCVCEWASESKRERERVSHNSVKIMCHVWYNYLGRGGSMFFSYLLNNRILQNNRLILLHCRTSRGANWWIGLQYYTCIILYPQVATCFSALVMR